MSSTWGRGRGCMAGRWSATARPAEVAADPASLTGQYLSGAREIAVPKTRRKGNGKKLTVVGATGNNLKNVTAEFPAGQVRLRDGRVGRRQVHADHRDAVQDRRHAA